MTNQISMSSSLVESCRIIGLGGKYDKNAKTSLCMHWQDNYLGIGLEINHLFGDKNGNTKRLNGMAARAC